MKKSLTIALDIDGVCADLVGKICELFGARARAGEPGIRALRPEDFKVYALHASLTPEEKRALDLYAGAIGMAASLPWYSGAQLFVRTLQEYGEVYAVTAPWKSSTWAKERQEWLSPVIDRAHVISAASEAKPFVCASADVLIEDRADTLAAWKHTAKAGAVGILIDRPWNRDVHFVRDYDVPVERARNYGEAARIVHALAMSRGAK